MLTLYFDTSFYVLLCKADDRLAVSTTSLLNSFQVRPVLSDVILRELLSSGDRPARDQLLVNRVRQFNLPPYRTRDDLMWEALLLSGQERVEFADTLKMLDDMMTEATSFSIAARREPPPQYAKSIEEAGKSFLSDASFPENLQSDLPQTLTAVRSLVEGLGITGINWDVEETPEGLQNLSEQLLARLEQPTVDRLEEHARIQDAVTGSDDRAYRVAAGDAHPRTHKRLSNTLRDTEHMLTFYSHRDSIDYLQVDAAQARLMKERKPPNRFVELGIAARCFSAGTLEDVVSVVRSLKSS
jgi:hypothetical protein